jgi:CHAD domain-containing protein
MKLSGDVRDCDIALSLLRNPWAKESSALRERIAERRASSRRMLAAELKEWMETAAAWRTSLGSTKPLDTTRLPKMADDFLRRGARVAVKRPDLARLHKFRIQTKRLRYSIEIMQPLLGEGAGAWSEPIQAVQKVLGQINDCRILLELDRELGGGKGVDGALHKRIDKKIREFRRIWRDQFSGIAAKEWLQALEPPPRKPMARSQTAAPAARAAKRA